jgi:hypothetical protein
LAGRCAFPQFAIGLILAAASIALSLLITPKVQKPKTDVTQPKSNYGIGLVRVFGRAVVGGNVFDSFKVQERKKKSGKGGLIGGKKRLPESFGTFAVFLGEGERSWNSFIYDGIPNGGLLTLKKLWLNESLVYDVDDIRTYNTSSIFGGQGGTVRRVNADFEQYFTFYNGSLTQTKDPTLVARRSATVVPGYRGYSYIVFNNLPLKDYGGQYPAVKAELESNLPATPLVMLRDIMARAGIWANRPLIEGRDWAFSAREEDGTANIPNDISILGFTITEDAVEMRAVIAELMQLFRLGVTTDPYTPYHMPRQGRSVKAKPELKIVDLQGTERDLRYELTGAELADYVVPFDFSVSPKAIQEVPSSVEVSVIDPVKAYETSSVTARRPTVGAAEPFTLNSNAVIEDKDTVNNIANYILELGFARGKVLKGVLSPSDTLIVPSTVGTFKQAVFNRSVSNSVPIFATNTVVQAAKTTIGANGVVEVEGFITDTEVVRIGTVPDVVLSPSAPVAALCGQTLLFEGPALNTPTTRNRRTINVLYAPTEDFLAPEGLLFISTDGGTTFRSTSQTAISTNAVVGTITAATDLPATVPVVEIIDRSTRIVVSVNDDFIELASISESRMYDFDSNVAYLPGGGLFSYATVTMISSGVYELRDILWNVGQSATDQAWDPSNNVWFFVGSPYELVVSSSVSIGDPITAVITPSGNADCPPTTMGPFRGLNAAPRPPFALSSSITPAGDVRFEWARGISQTIAPASLPTWPNDYPNDETFERYQVYITDGNVTRTLEVVNQKFAIYSAALIAADGMDVTDIMWGVVQEGALATIPLETEPWRLVPI